jgi:hypothetical protein
MKLTTAQLRKIIKEEVMKQKALNEYGLGALADDAQISKVKATLSTFVEHLRASAEAELNGDPQDVQDAVHAALEELMAEVFSEAGFSEMPLGYYRG